eukprot:CAMPEP_0117566984 /NCGR_PEP_ID=MMETSP0784-20121206/57370_1 /TAXON_ID=39447 /ORGANISM="" /LENGTH=114 /DNA_ID=CAMNT_0005364835 /DNA_START=217 /DNA_END=561 /DNA_ORIENTATION=+
MSYLPGVTATTLLYRRSSLLLPWLNNPSLIRGNALFTPLYVSKITTCALAMLEKTCESKATAELNVSWRWITNNSTASLFGRSETEKVPALASPILNLSKSPGFKGDVKSLHSL